LTNNETAVHFGSYQNLLPYWRLLFWVQSSVVWYLVTKV